MDVEAVAILQKPTPNRRPAERLRPPREVVVGMTLAQVIAARGRHYKPFAGPRVGQIALVYDDITLHIMGSTRPEFDGRVVAIETTDKEKAGVLVKDIPYADEQPGEPKEAPKLPADRTLKSHANEVQLPFAKKQSDRQDNAVRPGPGLIGRTFLEGKDVGLFFRYEHGKVFRHELVELKFIEKRDEKLPPKGVEVVLQGRLLVPRKMSVSARHAGGSVSHGVQTLFVDGKELGSVGDDRQKSRVYALLLEAGTHTVKWVLTGGRFGNNLLRFEDPDTGKSLWLSYSAEDLKEVGKISRNDLTDAASQERGWPIPQGW
jgi:hypothetical protein